MKHYDPIPLVHPGGIQPYSQAGGQMPGPALLAMMRGATFGGQNPINAFRGLQSAAGKRPMTLLDLLNR